MMQRFAILFALLAGTTGFAQVPQIAITRVDDPNVNTYTFGAAQCNDSLTLRWSNTLTFSLSTACSQNPMKLWASPGDSCPDVPAATDTKYEDVPSLTLNTLRQGTFTVKISELPDFKATTSADGGTLLACNGNTPFTKSHVICGSVEYAISSGISCGTATKMTATPLKLVFDTQPPTAPTITEYAAQDKGVRMGFSVDSDTTTVIMEATEYSDAGVGDYRELAEAAATSNFIHADGLQNNVPYLVRLRAKDSAGNVSEPTEALIVTPILTLGFWGYYRNAGGTDPGNGCSVGTGLMPLLLAAFAFRRARKQVRRQP